MYMSNQNYLRAEDVAEIMGISKAYAYKIMRKLNAELDEQGYITVSGAHQSKVLHGTHLLWYKRAEGR